MAHSTDAADQCLGIAAQIEAMLAAEAGPVVIDLSNAAISTAQPPRRTGRRPRRGRRAFPVLLAWPSANGRVLEAWCPWCRVWHVHGRHGADSDCGPSCPCGMHGGRHHSYRGPCLCPPGSGDGHRTAHCWTLSRSPMKATGYYVEEVTR